MPNNPPENTPRIAPYLYYENVAAALDWLSKVFGFTETVRMPGKDGTIGHAEMKLEDGLIMMGCPGPEYRSPAWGLTRATRRPGGGAPRAASR